MAHKKNIPKRNGTRFLTIKGNPAASRRKRETTMPNYRAYVVGPDGHFQAFDVIAADDDESAVKMAQTLVNGCDVEVWKSDRKVAVLSHEDSPSPK